MKSFLFSHPQRSSIYGTCRELLRRFSWRPIVQRIFQDSKGSFVLPWTGLNSVYHHIAKREERERMCLLHQCSSRTKKEPGHRVLSVIKFLTFKINIDFALSIWFHIVWKSPKMSHLNLFILAFSIMLPVTFTAIPRFVRSSICTNSICTNYFYWPKHSICTNVIRFVRLFSPFWATFLVIFEFFKYFWRNVSARV